MKFDELGPFLLERLDAGCGFEMTMVLFHNMSCRLNCNSTKYRNALKRVRKADSDYDLVLAACKHNIRYVRAFKHLIGYIGIHEAATHQIYKHVATHSAIY